MSDESSGRGQHRPPNLSNDVEAIIRRIQATYNTWGRGTTVDQMRADWDRLFSAKGNASTTPVMASGVACQWVAAPGVTEDKVVVYFHGGGFQIGSLSSHHELMANLSAASGARVLGVDYRMTPEHRYPAPLEDGLVVMSWLESQGFLSADVALAGDSAGGGLALAVMLALGQHRRPMPAAAVVMSAWTDMTISGASYETRSALDPIHQRPMLLALSRNYLGKTQDPTDPLASPLLASSQQLASLPPLLLQVGERETLVSDSEELANKVVAAGGQAQCQIWPGMIHVFQQFPAELDAARQAIASAGAFLSGHLSLTSTAAT